MMKRGNIIKIFFIHAIPVIGLALILRAAQADPTQWATDPAVAAVLEGYQYQLGNYVPNPAAAYNFEAYQRHMNEVLWHEQIRIIGESIPFNKSEKATLGHFDLNDHLKADELNMDLVIKPAKPMDIRPSKVQMGPSNVKPIYLTPHSDVPNLLPANIRAKRPEQRFENIFAMGISKSNPEEDRTYKYLSARYSGIDQNNDGNIVYAELTGKNIPLDSVMQMHGNFYDDAYMDKHNKALLNAAKQGDDAALKTELDAGANVNTIDHQGYNALMYAVGGESIEMVKVLLAAGADLGQRGNDNKSAVTIAANNQSIKSSEEIYNLIISKAGDEQDKAWDELDKAIDALPSTLSK